MREEKLKSLQGLYWYGEGLRICKVGWVIWGVAAAFFFLFALTLLFLLGGVGAKLDALIGPFFLAGFLTMASAAQKGEPLQIGMLFQGFKDSSIRRYLLVLGFIGSVSFTLLGVAWFPFIEEPARGPRLEGSATMFATIARGLGFAMAFGLVILVGLAFLFAIPLVVFAKTDPIDALATSLAACRHNAGAISVFVLISLALALIAYWPYMLGFLLLIPLSMVATYQAFTDIFPQEAGMGKEAEISAQSP